MSATTPTHRRRNKSSNNPTEIEEKQVNPEIPRYSRSRCSRLTVAASLLAGVLLVGCGGGGSSNVAKECDTYMAQRDKFEEVVTTNPGNYSEDYRNKMELDTQEVRIKFFTTVANAAKGQKDLAEDVDTVKEWALSQSEQIKANRNRPGANLRSEWLDVRPGTSQLGDWATEKWPACRGFGYLSD